MDLVLRPLTRDDIPAWADAAGRDRGRRAHRRALQRGRPRRGDGQPRGTEVGKDFVGAFDGDELVGYFSVLPARRPRKAPTRCTSQGAVLPDAARRGDRHRAGHGDGRRGPPRRAAERRPDLPARLTTTGLSTNAAQEDLLDRARDARRALELRDAHGADRPAGAAAGRRRLPDPALRRAMGRAVLAAHNLAFDGSHPGFTPWTDDHVEAVGHRQPHVPAGASASWSSRPAGRDRRLRRRPTSSTPTPPPPGAARRTSPRSARSPEHRGRGLAARAAGPLPARLRRGRLRRGVARRRLGEPDRCARASTGAAGSRSSRAGPTTSLTVPV